MNEEQIESRVERAFDSLDSRLMSGALTQDEYDAEAEKIRAWADEKLDRI